MSVKRKIVPIFAAKESEEFSVKHPKVECAVLLVEYLTEATEYLLNKVYQTFSH